MPTPAPPTPAAYDLDMTRLEDEQLVELAHQCGFRPARDELIFRCLGVARHLVSHHASCTRLQQADSQDAEQDAVLWILEAIERYRTAESVKPGGCHFRSFAHRVLASRLTDFFRQRRVRIFVSLAGHGAAGLRRDLDRPRDDDRPTPAGPDPLASAEQDEVQARLRRELARLGEADRRLWDLLAAGTPLRQVAAAFGISYDGAKRRRQKLLTRLKSSLTGE